MSKRNPEGIIQDEIVRHVERHLGGICLKNDATSRQGIPDLTVFLPGGVTVLLEVKKARPTPSSYRPNQQYYLDRFRKMRHTAWTVFPGNIAQVKDNLAILAEKDAA